MMFLYSTALALGLTLSAPWWLLRMVTTKRYREGLGERLGRVPARLRAAVAGRRVVWLHAVSVGEVLAGSRLLGELEAALNASSSGAGVAPWLVVVSTTTRTGQALARERFGAERVFYFPLDFAWAVRAYLRVLKPAVLLLMESELWPRVLHECRRSGVPVAVVNARVSDRSFARAMRVRGVWGRVLRGVSLWLMQSDEDARRIVAMGAREGAVRVGGNLKYDVRAPKTEMIDILKPLLDRRQLVIAGSLLEGEEQHLLEKWWAIRSKAPEAVLLLAPRHPDRFAAVVELASNQATLTVYTATSLRDQAKRPDALKRMGPLAVLVLDTIGDLAGLYSLADVAFVGGSLVRRGGHNPLEPAQFGVPVVMGPSFENFRDIVGRMQAMNAIRILQNEEELEGAISDLLAHPGEAQAMGERGRKIFEEQGGATGRAVEAIIEMVDMMQGENQ